MNFYRDIFLTKRFFLLLIGVVILFVFSFIVDGFILVPKLFFFLSCAVILADGIILFRIRQGIRANRITPDKLSNGDENEIQLTIENKYPFKVRCEIIDEIPHQFQKRDVLFREDLGIRQHKSLRYVLRPVKRGEYSFGTVNIFTTSPLKLLIRRYRFSGEAVVPVYPSYVQMRRYELLAISNRLTEVGVKKIRRVGHNQEFELIKEYVPGDDVRTINWRATARRTHLMVNHYQDERSQQVISLIDKSRVMQMPFNGMSLLDYAINATLVISNIAIKRFDKAGVITFQNTIDSTLPPSRTSRQMNNVLELLYNQRTGYRESDFSVVYSHLRRKISHRSLLLLFTNFESMYGLQRQLPYLKNLTLQHVVVVIFFENTELTSLVREPAHELKEIYYKAVAEQFMHDKKRIARELQLHGIQTILTPPEQLTVNTINKYLEIKARGMI